MKINEISCKEITKIKDLQSSHDIVKVIISTSKELHSVLDFFDIKKEYNSKIQLCFNSELLSENIFKKLATKNLYYKINYKGDISLDNIKKYNLGERITINFVLLHDLKGERNYNSFKKNYQYLTKILKLKKVEISINCECSNSLLLINELADIINGIRYVSLRSSIKKINGFPFCLISDPEELISYSAQKNNFYYYKIDKCEKCSYKKYCHGIPVVFKGKKTEKLIKPNVNPKEVMVELTSRCNFSCKFCFNHASFAKNGHGGDEMSLNIIKKLVDNIAKENIPIVRFTGGEPLLREDLLEILRYAKSKNLSVRMNTNGYLIKNYAHAKSLVKYLDYVLFSFHTINPKEDEIITGVKNSFEKKVQAIKWFKRAGIKIIRVSTIATKENIKNLEKFYIIFKELKINRWATNRLIPISENEDKWGVEELKMLVKKLYIIKKRAFLDNISMQIHIVNGIPLCALEPVKMNYVSIGAKSVDGHERYVVDPRGFIKPIYYIDKNIGDIDNLKRAWNSKLMKDLRNYCNLPKECQKCYMLEKCKGGNRYCAYYENGSYRAKDPLMNYNNIKNFL